MALTFNVYYICIQYTRWKFGLNFNVLGLNILHLLIFYNKTYPVASKFCPSFQNLVLFDGVPVYNAGHALGIFSIFNSNVVKSATLIKGGFPARYGGRLSSVLDVRTREGSTKKMEGAVSISAIAMKASIEGPIGKNGSSYLFSARRTFVDRWIKSKPVLIIGQMEMVIEGLVIIISMISMVN